MRKRFLSLLALAACSNAAAATLAFKAPVMMACGPSSCVVTWFFHAQGPVTRIVSTISVAGVLLRTDTLPGTATQDTATVAMVPGQSGLACVRNITATPAQAACLPFTSSAVVIDSVIAKSLLLDSLSNRVVAEVTTIPAKRRALFCTYGFVRGPSGSYVTRSKFPATVTDWDWRAAVCDSVGRAKYDGAYKV